MDNEWRVPPPPRCVACGVRHTPETLTTKCLELPGERQGDAAEPCGEEGAMTARRQVTVTLRFTSAKERDYVREQLRNLVDIERVDDKTYNERQAIAEKIIGLFEVEDDG